jgi:hypothetical protein
MGREEGRFGAKKRQEGSLAALGMTDRLAERCVG